MSITIGRYTFEGPYTNTADLQDRSGVYAIHDQRNGTYHLVDVGESAQVKTRVENHDRRPCWNGNNRGVLTVSALYTPNLQQASRMAIEQELRRQFNPPCGDR
jgi:hypothetical protein